MNINKNNYEAFFLDYHEGNLTAIQVAALLLFVEQHPELKEEFENFENCTIEDFSFPEFENKSVLKKEVTTLNQQDYLIGLIENTLNDGEKKVVADFLNEHPAAKAELELLRKTILKADKTVVYENKNALKRSTVTTSIKAASVYYYAAVAASVMLLIGLFFLNKINNSTIDVAKTTLIKANRSEKPLMIKSETEAINAEIKKKIIKHHTKKIKPVKTNTIINAKEALQEEQNNVASLLHIEEQPRVLAVRKEILNSNEASINKYLDENLNKIAKQEHLIKKEEFVSLHELAAERLKEKLLDENDIYEQKKNGHLKKINGWDIAQIITKGISKFSGRKFELKPYYNNKGNVTSYALIAGEFKLSKGHQ